MDYEEKDISKIQENYCELEEALKTYTQSRH